MAQKRSQNFDTKDLIENTPYNRHIVATYARRTAKKLEKLGLELDVAILKESQLKFMNDRELTAYRKTLQQQYNDTGYKPSPITVHNEWSGEDETYGYEDFDRFYRYNPSGRGFKSERNPIQPRRTKKYYEKIQAENHKWYLEYIKNNTVTPPTPPTSERSDDYKDKFNKGYTNIDDYEEIPEAPEVDNFPDYDTFDYDADSKIEPDEESDLGGFSGTAQGRANVQPTSWYDDETGEIIDEKGLNEWMAANIIIENARTVINQFKYYAGPDKSKKHQAEYRNNAYEVEFILDNAIEQMGARHVAMALQEMADNGQAINYEFFYKDKPNTDFYQSLTNALQATADANESLNDMLEADDWDGYDDGEDY